MRTFTGEAQGQTLADAHGRTGYKHSLSFVVDHMSSPYLISEAA
jgi:hypothetical protein